MSHKFIDLNRTFTPIPKNHTFNEDDFDLHLDFGLVNTKKWEDLLQLTRVVILAEAGSGKTEELKEKARELHDEGKAAFFFRLEHLGSNFETAFDEVGTPLEFENWLKTEEPGWFFLDSVDEAKLCGYKQFEAAIALFGIKLAGHKQRAHIFITSRISEWRPQSDLSLINTKIPFFELETSTEQNEGDLDLLEDISKKEVFANKKIKPKRIDPEVFALCPLDRKQRQMFSQAFDIQDVDAFLAVIEKKEAEIFSSWPQDLLELIEYWKAHGKISNRAELIKENIRLKLKERDPDRALRLPLSFDKTNYGAEMLAAAVTFLRKSRILVPEQNIDPLRKNDAIDVCDVLRNWTVQELSALLQRPIFGKAIYGCVRFHHRIVREYLTAQWLYRLLQNGKSRRAIEALFFKERYGRRVLVPSIRPILSWLILFDDSIREKALDIAPEICLEGGDPSSLPIEMREALLTKFCAFYSEQKRWGFLFDISEVRRFSDPGLGEKINHLLKIYQNHEEIRGLLLRMVWQGEIEDCTETALRFALNSDNDIYTRRCGIRSVGSTGSRTQKEELVRMFLSDKTLKKKEVIGEVIAAFAPDTLATQDVLTLIERANSPDPYSYTSLFGNFKEYCVEKCPENEIIILSKGIFFLLNQPPFIERRHFGVSMKYRWLLPFAALAVERLVRLKHPHALESSAVEIISHTQNAIHYHDHHHYLRDHKLAELVPHWSQLNDTLFWFDVETERSHLARESNRRLTDFWQANPYASYWKFTSNDFDEVLRQVALKPKLDDRLVALSLALQLYREAGRGRVRLQALKKVVRGVQELEEKLHLFLNSPPMSKEEKMIRQSNADFKRRMKKQEKKTAENEAKSRKWLQANPHVLLDTGDAKTGGFQNATVYLSRKIGEKEGNINHYATPQWEVLIPEFGQNIAQAYRDGCIDYWRKYRPKLRSEGIEDPNSTPYAVIIGLNGLAMEVNLIQTWPNNLSKEEAEFACRYATKELNGFSKWLPKLHSAFPDIVESVLLKEIEWELSEYDGNEQCHYVLSNIAHGSDWLKPKISHRMLSLLRDYKPKHDDTLNNALGIVLDSLGLEQATFVEIAKTKVEEILSHSRQALWLAAWMCVDANGALERLNAVLDNLSDTEDATQFSILFIISLLGDGRVNVQHTDQDFIRPDILPSLIRLMYSHIRTSEDIDRAGTGVYSPGLRDNAQDARNRLFNLLSNIPGEPTYRAMIDLSKHANNESKKEWYAVSAKRRAEADAEADPWRSEDIGDFAKDAERMPQNHRELFDLAVLRLLDLKAELEDGDTSTANILVDVRHETKHRNFIADWLRKQSRGRYSVPQEDELADGARPDIRIYGAGIDGPVPIELKITDNNWSGPDLFDGLKNQLCGQYLRDSRSNCGIYLIVSRVRNKHWEHPESRKHLDFSDLERCLKEEAEKIISKNNQIEALEIIGIDLSKRTT